MKLTAYCIYDTAAGAYMRPFFLQSDAQAIRAFKDIALDANHEVGKHPEDYALFRVGIFDDNSGELIPENRECLSTALEQVSAAQNVNRDNLELFDKSLKEAN